MNLLFKEINMLSGLEIVLERIKEYPEEWNKWASLVEDYAQHFTKEEVQAWQNAITQMSRERFNEKVLKRLSGEDIEVEKQVTGFQNEVSRIVASKQHNAIKQSMMGYSDPQLMYGDPMRPTQSAAAQQAAYNPYANNIR
jgi:hypothetical protein